MPVCTFNMVIVAQTLSQSLYLSSNVGASIIRAPSRLVFFFFSIVKGKITKDKKDIIINYQTYKNFIIILGVKRELIIYQACFCF